MSEDSVKFIHTADLHIGKSRTFPDYLERQELMLDGIYKIAKDFGANVSKGEVNVKHGEQESKSDSPY